MKIDRLIGIIMILLQRDKATVAELAERFEVSARTINRDVEDICKAGLPLVTVQGYRGGISFAEGYKIDKTFFTREELQSILTGLKGIDSISEEAYFFRLIENSSDQGSDLVEVPHYVQILLGKGRKRTTNRAVSPDFQMVVLVYVRILPGQGGLPTFQIKSPLEIAALKRTLFAAGAFAGRSIV